MMPNESMVSVVGIFVTNCPAPVISRLAFSGAVGKNPSKFCPAVVGVSPAAEILANAC